MLKLPKGTTSAAAVGYEADLLVPAKGEGDTADISTYCQESN